MLLPPPCCRQPKLLDLVEDLLGDTIIRRESSVILLTLSLH